jgi:predicted ATPase
MGQLTVKNFGIVKYGTIKIAPKLTVLIGRYSIEIRDLLLCLSSLASWERSPRKFGEEDELDFMESLLSKTEIVYENRSTLSYNGINRGITKIGQKNESEDLGAVISVYTVDELVYIGIRPHDLLIIREEMELGLSIVQQKEVLSFLLEHCYKGGQVIMTTNSPYIINYLALAIKAHELWNNPKVDHDRLQSIVPKESAIGIKDVAIYEVMDETITLLPTPLGLPSDENYLNAQLARTNNLFTELLEIEG